MISKGGLEKRGLSPVIASVLMIALVMVLASFIFLWARGFISEQIEKFGQPVEGLCSSVNFNVELIPSPIIDSLEAVNLGNVDIFYLEIKLSSGGNSEISKFKSSIPAGGSAQENLKLLMKDGSLPEKIEIFPALIGNVKGKSSNKVFTCLDQGRVVDF